MSLYKLVTTENVDLNYKAFKKDELIDCISNLRTTYFRLKKENGEINFLGNCYGENARCLDLLIKENQELKKQVEVSNELVAQSTLTEMKLRNEFNRWKKEYQDTYKDVRIEIKEYKTQQKEFIKFLEDNYESTQDIWYIKILQKYKSIIGDDK